MRVWLLVESHREVGISQPAWRCARGLVFETFFETGLPDSQEAEKATKLSDN